MAFFEIIEVGDPRLRSCLDGIRIICNPSEKQSAHVTVAGPFQSAPEPNGLRDEVPGSPIAVYGIGHFFKPGQNTVMLECDAPIIGRVWRKNVYGYHPHITLYNGRSRSFAEALEEVGASLDLQFDFPAGRLIRIQSAKGQYDFGMTSGLSYDFLSSVVGAEVQMSTLSQFTSAERLRHAAKLLQFVSMEFAQGQRSGGGRSVSRPA